MFVLRRFRAVTKINVLSRASRRHCSFGLRLSVLSEQDVLDGVPHFDVEITEDNVDEMAKVIIRHIKKSWNVSNLQRSDFKGGLSNKVVGYLPVSKKGWGAKFENFRLSDTVLIRMYGEKTDIVKDHTRELRNIDELAKNNIIPPLYCTFANGYCCEFLEGRVCTPADFRNRDILRLTASSMAELHTAELSDHYLAYHKMQSPLFDNIGYYLSAIPPRYNVELQKRFERNMPHLQQLRDEVATMCELISSFEDMAVTYCHNDFHPINLIFDELEGTMHVIDHERGSPNYSAYDIGNYFNEFAGIRDINYSLYPTKETRFWWLKTYLQKINELNGTNEIVTNTDVRQLGVQAEIMSLVSHLFWVSWALFRAGYPVSDFDYMGYAITRHDEYHRRKREAQRNISII